MFLLAIGAGLRAGEIDSLLWQQIDLDASTVTIEATKYFHPKSEDSTGVVEIDRGVAEILRGYRARAESEFVLESDRPPRPEAKYYYRRAKPAFDFLTTWLRSKGVEAKKPLHELRKEFGSIICQQAGVYAASRALRHADVSVTASHYLDRKERVTVGIGKILEATDKDLHFTKEEEIA